MTSFIDIAKKTFWVTREEDFESLLEPSMLFTLGYFALTFTIGFVITSVIMVAGSKETLVALVAAIIDMAIYGLGVAVILPIVSHALLKILGCSRPFQDTLKIYMFGSTPSMLAIWIPCIGIVAPLVSFGNVFRGIREINKLPFWKPLIAVLLPSLGYWIGWLVLIMRF